MRWLPTPPTDNFYKYLAINSLWLAFGTLTLWVVMYTNAPRTEEYGRLGIAITKQSIDLRLVKNRIAALENDKPELYKIESLPQDEFQSTSEELLYLKIRQEIAEETIANLKDKRGDIDPFELHQIFEDSGAYIWLPILMVIAFGSTVLTFGAWYFRVQKPLDDIQQADLELKQAQLLEHARSQVGRKWRRDR